jgi:ABC-type nitrate/sulfonate/bicarbonate transport system permease component
LRSLVRLAALVIVVAALEVAITSRWVSPLTVARPSDVAVTLYALMVSGNGLEAFFYTFSQTLAAAAVASLIGIPTGLLLFRYDLCDQAFRGWIAAIASAPLVLLYPLFLVVLGRNVGTLVAIGAVAALAPIIIKTRDGLYGIRPTLLNVGRSLGARPQVMFWSILLPAAAPTIINGLRLGLVFALVNIVAVEYLINFGGLGQLVGEMADRFDMPGVYSAIIFVVIVSALFYLATERLEQWLRPH